MADILYRLIVFCIFLLMYVSFLEIAYAGKDDNYSNRHFLIEILPLTAGFIIVSWFIMFGGGGCV
jgi:hypothetical protein